MKQKILLILVRIRAALTNIDYAIYKIDAVNKFLMQQTDEKFDFEDEVTQLSDIFADYEAFENGSLQLKK